MYQHTNKQQQQQRKSKITFHPSLPPPSSENPEAQSERRQLLRHEHLETKYSCARYLRYSVCTSGTDVTSDKFTLAPYYFHGWWVAFLIGFYTPITGFADDTVSRSMPNDMI